MQAQISSENLESLVSGQQQQPQSLSSSPQLPSLSSSPQLPSNYFELKNQIDKDTFHIGC